MRYKRRPHVLLRIKNVLTQPSVHKSMPRRTVNKGSFLQPPRAFCSIIKQSLVLCCSVQLPNLDYPSNPVFRLYYSCARRQACPKSKRRRLHVLKSSACSWRDQSIVDVLHVKKPQNLFIIFLSSKKKISCIGLKCTYWRATWFIPCKCCSAFCFFRGFVKINYI